MPNWTQKDFGFPSSDRRKIEAYFAGGDVSGDRGLLLLRQSVYGIAQGYEDLNDDDTLRDDQVWPKPFQLPAAKRGRPFTAFPSSTARRASSCAVCDQAACFS